MEKKKGRGKGGKEGEHRGERKRRKKARIRSVLFALNAEYEMKTKTMAAEARFQLLEGSASSQGGPRLLLCSDVPASLAFLDPPQFSGMGIPLQLIPARKWLSQLGHRSLTQGTWKRAARPACSAIINFGTVVQRLRSLCCTTSEPVGRGFIVGRWVTQLCRPQTWVTRELRGSHPPPPVT